MNPQKTKIIIAAVAALVVLGSLAGLNSSRKRSSGSGSATEEAETEDARRSRIRRGTFSGDDSSAAAKKGSKNSSKDDAAADKTSTGTLAADASTTGAVFETEAETRERERYERAQANAFKYRKLDPNKIKPTPLEPALKDSAEKYKIPYEVLAAMMYVESGGAHRDGGNSIEAGYGVMNLKENNLVDTAAEAASLLGRQKEELLYDQALNIEGAAALLNRYYEDALASGVSEQEAWYMAVSQYSGRPNPELAAALADETAGWMMKGFEVNLADGGGSFRIPPNPNPPFMPKNWKLVGIPAPGGSTPAPSVVPRDTNP